MARTPAGAARSSTSRGRGIEQIRAHGLDPFAYFEWVFGKLMLNPGPDQMPALLPAEWIRLQREEKAEEAAEAAA